MRSYLCAFALLCLAHPSAWAVSPSSAEALNAWTDSFPTSPLVLEKDSITKLIGISEDCHIAIEIENDVSKYGELLKQNRTSAEIRSLNQKIQTKIRNLSESRASKVCIQNVYATYAAASMALLVDAAGQPPIHDISADDLAFLINNRANRTTIEATRARGKARLNLDTAWVYATISASRSGLMKFEATTVQNRNSDKRILGYYDCENTVLVVDPHQAPLNFAASVLHEFTHFFMDKFSALNSQTASLATEKQRELILIDETVAALHAGYFQRRFAEKYLADRKSFVDLDDLTFFSTEGSLSHYAMKSDKRRAGAIELNDLRSIYQFQLVLNQLFTEQTNFIFKRSETGPLRSVENPQAPKDLPQYRRQLYDNISEVYFQRTLDRNSQAGLSPLGLDGSYPGLWREDVFGNRGPLVSQYFLPLEGLFGFGNQVTLMGRTGNLRGDYSSLIAVDSKGQELDLMPAAKLFLVGFGTSQHRPSELCRHFGNAVRANHLSDYVGVKLSPGKPGTEGVMPSHSGSKPGTEGVMPSRPVRPCVQIGDRFGEPKL